MCHHSKGQAVFRCRKEQSLCTKEHLFQSAQNPTYKKILVWGPRECSMYRETLPYFPWTCSHQQQEALMRLSHLEAASGPVLQELSSSFWPQGLLDFAQFLAATVHPIPPHPTPHKGGTLRIAISTIWNWPRNTHLNFSKLRNPFVPSYK